MRVEIIRNVMISGEPVKAGSFVEVDLVIANLLINSGKAKVVSESEPDPTPEPKLEIQQKTVESAPKPASRRGRPKKTSPED